MLSEASRLLLKLKSTDEYCYILFSAFNKIAEEPKFMSEISSNFGMESLNVAMLKRSSDNQGQMALALLEGAVQTSQQIQANAPAAPQVQPVAHAEGTLGANIDITA